MKPVLETDGKTVQGTDSVARRTKVGIEFCSALDGWFEEDLCDAGVLVIKDQSDVQQ